MARSCSPSVPTRESLSSSSFTTTTTADSITSNTSYSLTGSKSSIILAKVKEDTLFRFTWSETESDCECSMSDASDHDGMNVHDGMSDHDDKTSNAKTKAKAKSKSQDSKDSKRHIAPPLPPPIFWSTLVHDEVFEEYIAKEYIAPGVRRPIPVDSTGENQPPTIIPEHVTNTLKALTQEYGNAKTIETLNGSHLFLTQDTNPLWVLNLLSDDKLPVPFQVEAVCGTKHWLKKDASARGSDTLSTIPELTEEKTAKWLDKLCAKLGFLHGLVPMDPDEESEDEDYGWKCLDGNPFRVFNPMGRNKALSGGISQRKPDIMLLERSHPYKNATTKDHLNWGPVLAVVEVSTQESHYKAMMTTLLEKAAQIFYSQLHRNHVLGLALYGKKGNEKYFFTLIDRGGALSTRPEALAGNDGLIFCRILFALAFGSNKLLGIDPDVETDPITGAAVSVLVDHQRFQIVKEIYIAPFLSSRGTRTYIVKDQNGRFHVLKDSWPQMGHAADNPEIEHLKTISAKAREKLASVIAEAMTTSNSGKGKEKMTDDPIVSAIRSYLLTPKFIAGDEHVFDTNIPRRGGLVQTAGYPRIRRRVVEGPICNPITSYRSRVECIQAFIDIADQLKFLDEDCDLLHSDVSMGNVGLVRFLPNILLGALEEEGFEDDLAQYLSELKIGEHAEVLPPNSSIKPIMSPKSFYNVSSGGSVIDFDYTSRKGGFTTKASGTMPYMSVEIQPDFSRDLDSPFQHRVDHDLESLFLVLLHIVRFTSGPAGDPKKDIISNKLEVRISQWHHEQLEPEIPHTKSSDLLRLRSAKDIKSVLPKYWSPFTANIANLSKIVYPQKTIPLRTGVDIFTVFRQELVNFLEACKEIEEVPHSYGVTMPFQSASPLKKRSAKRAQVDSESSVISKRQKVAVTR